MSLTELLDERFLSSEQCKLALTHCSASVENNERLEYLGDSLLGFSIASWLFKSFPDYSEGDLTRLRAHLVRKETLGDIARAQNLGQRLLVGAGELKSGGAQRTSILADALEALIGAVYLGKGLEFTFGFIEKLYQDHFENMPTREQLKDAKTRLQELLQSDAKALPDYHLINRHGKSGNETFTVQCMVEDCSEAFVGKGANRRKAEQLAAERALEHLSRQCNEASR